MSKFDERLDGLSLDEKSCAMFTAACTGNLQRIQQLLDLGVPVDVQWMNATPLFDACVYGNTDAVKFNFPGLTHR